MQQFLVGLTKRYYAFSMQQAFRIVQKPQFLKNLDASLRMQSKLLRDSFEQTNASAGRKAAIATAQDKRLLNHSLVRKDASAVISRNPNQPFRDLAPKMQAKLSPLGLRVFVQHYIASKLLHRNEHKLRLHKQPYSEYLKSRKPAPLRASVSC